jgi:parallel beta-helix repeat protein
MFQLALTALGCRHSRRAAVERDASRRRRRNRLAPVTESLEVRDCPSGAASHLGLAESAHALLATKHTAAQTSHEAIPMKKVKQKAPQTIYVSPKGKTGATAGRNASHAASLTVALKRAKAGATIVLAPGVYTQLAAINGKSGITIQGAANNSSILAASGNYAAKVYSSSGITLENVWFRSPNGSGLAIVGSSVNLVNVRTDGTHGYGVVVGGAGTVNATSSHFDSVQTGDGLDVRDGSATVNGCTFNNNGTAGGSIPGGSGLSAEASSHVTITNSQLNGNLNSNLVAYNQAQVNAQDSTFNSSRKGNGAIFSDQVSVSLSGNTFASNGQVFGPTTGFNGIEFFSKFTGSATISGNTFTGNTESGLFISGTSSAIQVTGNTFTDNFVGLNMDASSASVNAVIKGNTFMVALGSTYQGLDAAGSGVTATIGGDGSAQNIFKNYAYGRTGQSSILQFHVSAGQTVGCPNLSILTNTYLSGGNPVDPSQAILPC